MNHPSKIVKQKLLFLCLLLCLSRITYLLVFHDEESKKCIIHIDEG